MLKKEINRKKNCILYLARDRKNDYENLIRSLFFLKKNFLKENKCDIIIFHEKNFKKNLILEAIKLDIIFIKISFKVPKYPNNIKKKIPLIYPHHMRGKRGFSLGYRHMCRFFSGAVYEEKILQYYDYYLRLDTDSFILSEVKYNIFDWAKKNNCYYGFIKEAVQFDHPSVTIGLWKLFNYPKNIQEGKMFYTNFELGKINFFKSTSYKNFFNKIDKSAGIFTKRWGDAPIKYIGIRLFMSNRNIMPVSGFLYQHSGSFYDTRKKLFRNLFPAYFLKKIAYIKYNIFKIVKKI